MGLGIDVDEDRACANLGYGFGGGDECVGDRDDRIPRADPGRHEGEAQGVGPGTDANAVSAVAKGREFLFETGYLGPTDEHAGRHGFSDGGDDFIFDLLVLGFEV